MAISRARGAIEIRESAWVWRYLPFEYFRDLVVTRELYLRRLDRLQDLDPHEGRWLSGADDLTFTAGVSDPAPLIAQLEAERERTFVSCWTLRLDEQRAMWDRHPVLERPVAIRTTVGDLMHALVDTPADLAIGGVHYCDTLREFVDRFPLVNTYNLAFCKRTKFGEEQEVRLVFQDSGEGQLDDHVRISIDLGRLHAGVVLGPDSDAALRSDVLDLLAVADLEWKVHD